MQVIVNQGMADEQERPLENVILEHFADKPDDLAVAVARILQLLAEKGVLQASDIGNLFFIDLAEKSK